MTSYAKRWCFTINNYKEEDIERLDKLGNDEGTRYLIYGKEKGKKETPHLQGYIEFVKKRPFAPAKKAVGDNCHIELARGTGKKIKNIVLKKKTIKNMVK